MKNYNFPFSTVDPSSISLSSKVTDVRSFNRRLILAEEIPFKLAEEFKAAAQHLHMGSNEMPYQMRTLNSDVYAVDETDYHEFSDAPYLGKLGLALTHGDCAYMEDRVLATLLRFAVNGQEYQWPLYGVFDGHGGSACCDYLQKHLRKYLVQKFTENDRDEVSIFNILKLAFVDLGDRYRQLHQYDSECHAGSTATIALIIDDNLWIANVGDSRAVLNLNGLAVPLSEDAKPSLTKYQIGVLIRGGRLIHRPDDAPRVKKMKGTLAIARAVGHDEATGINPRAKIVKYPIGESSDNSQHLIIASDGLWDVMSSFQVVEFVQEHALMGKSCSQIARELVETAYMKGSEDNISALITHIKKM